MFMRLFLLLHHFFVQRTVADLDVRIRSMNAPFPEAAGFRDPFQWCIFETDSCCMIDPESSRNSRTCPIAIGRGLYLIAAKISEMKIGKTDILYIFPAIAFNEGRKTCFSVDAAEMQMGYFFLSRRILGSQSMTANQQRTGTTGELNVVEVNILDLDANTFRWILRCNVYTRACVMNDDIWKNNIPDHAIAHSEPDSITSAPQNTIRYCDKFTVTGLFQWSSAGTQRKTVIAGINSAIANWNKPATVQINTITVVCAPIGVNI